MLPPVCWISKNRGGVEHYLYLDPARMEGRLLAVLEHLGYRFYRYEGARAVAPLPRAAEKFDGSDEMRYGDFSVAESEAWRKLKEAREAAVKRRPTFDELRKQRDEILKRRKDESKKHKSAPVR